MTAGKSRGAESSHRLAPFDHRYISGGPALAIGGKRYALKGLSYAGRMIGVSYAFSDEKQLTAELKLPPEARVISVSRANGEPAKFARKKSLWEVEMENYEQYRVRTAGMMAG